MPNVNIHTDSGFCFGVVTAIHKAEEELKKGELYCLGDIVHNSREVKRLEHLGLKTITYKQYQQLHNVKVLFRAHGEPPSTYRTAQNNNINIIDASCPVVLNLQKKIRQTYQDNPHAQIVIYGKKGHAEVVGLQGQTDNTAIVVENIQDLEKINFAQDIYLFSQTTKSVDDYADLVDIIQKKIKPEYSFQWFDTICKQVRNRVKQIRQFAAEQDILIFVGGRNSSNGKVLYEHCKNANPNTIFIEDANELTTEYIRQIKDKKIGICGATSTPLWLMEQCADKILKTQ